MSKESKMDSVCANCGKEFNLVIDGGKYTQTGFFDSEEEKILELCFCGDSCYNEFMNDPNKFIRIVESKIKEGSL